MNISGVVRLVCVTALLSGCAMGNQYDYRIAEVPMSAEGDSKIGVSVEDSRPYVLSGDKGPNFIGLQRGGFGNPFDVTTASGRPLAEDMRESLAKSLTARGFQVVPLNVMHGNVQGIASAAQKDGLTRVVALDVKEWKSDVMMRVTMHHDLVLGVYDAQGKLLAQAHSARKEAAGGARFESDNAATARSEFERVLGAMFEDPAVKSALE